MDLRLIHAQLVDSDGHLSARLPRSDFVRGQLVLLARCPWFSA